MTYAYAETNPLSKIDPKGLAIWICSRGAFGGYFGNHTYLWDDKENRCCGMNRPHNPLTTCKEKGPFGKDGDSCFKVGYSDGKEDEIMKCCEKKAEQSWWPKYDCLDLAYDCITEQHLVSPVAPGGRFGECDSCYNKP